MEEHFRWEPIYLLPRKNAKRGIQRCVGSGPHWQQKSVIAVSLCGLASRAEAWGHARRDCGATDDDTSGPTVIIVVRGARGVSVILGLKAPNTLQLKLIEPSDIIVKIAPSVPK